MTRTLIEIASEIVQTQVSQTNMTAPEITASLRQVFNTLHDLHRVESREAEQLTTGEPERAKATAPQDSIQDDKVICLECGAEMKQLTKLHLVSHNLTAREYKKKYGFTMRTALAARSLTKARSKAAKKRGVPENLKKFMEQRRLIKGAAPEQTQAQEPKRTKIRKKAE
jgi:predicted transcriptional regulator